MPPKHNRLLSPAQRADLIKHNKTNGAEMMMAVAPVHITRSAARKLPPTAEISEEYLLKIIFEIEAWETSDPGTKLRTRGDFPAKPEYPIDNPDWVSWRGDKYVPDGEKWTAESTLQMRKMVSGLMCPSPSCDTRVLRFNAITLKLERELSEPSYEHAEMSEQHRRTTLSDLVNDLKTVLEELLRGVKDGTITLTRPHQVVDHVTNLLLIGGIGEHICSFLGEKSIGTLAITSKGLNMAAKIGRSDEKRARLKTIKGYMPEGTMLWDGEFAYSGSVYARKFEYHNGIVFRLHGNEYDFSEEWQLAADLCLYIEPALNSFYFLDVKVTPADRYNEYERRIERLESDYLPLSWPPPDAKGYIRRPGQPSGLYVNVYLPNGGCEFKDKDQPGCYPLMVGDQMPMGSKDDGQGGEVPMGSEDDLGRQVQLKTWFGLREAYTWVGFILLANWPYLKQYLMDSVSKQKGAYHSRFAAINWAHILWLDQTTHDTLASTTPKEYTSRYRFGQHVK
jgi:hypothetical protein